ncbi:MAG: hypothetical protein ACPGWR_11260 [Ardenticatenaceae bacterium]
MVEQAGMLRPRVPRPRRRQQAGLLIRQTEKVAQQRAHLSKPAPP